MGRPPDGDEARSAVVILRVLPAERDRWKAAAERAGVSMSAWLRALANAASAPTKGKKS